MAWGMPILPCFSCDCCTTNKYKSCQCWSTSENASCLEILSKLGAHFLHICSRSVSILKLYSRQTDIIAGEIHMYEMVETVFCFRPPSPELYTALPHNTSLSCRGGDLTFSLLQFHFHLQTTPHPVTVGRNKKQYTGELVSVTLFSPPISMILGLQHT